MKEKTFNGRPYNKDLIEDLILGKGVRISDKPECYDEDIDKERAARATLEAMGL